jgi:hypothetical protein
MRKGLFPGSLALLVLSEFSVVWPQMASPMAQMETQVKRVALFKNGLGFFMREGKLPMPMW